MRVPEPTLTGHLFAPLHDELLTLLRGLSAEEWEQPTVAGAWTVKDVAAHLLDTALRRLSLDRDSYAPPLPPDAFANGLGGFVNAMNREGVAVLRRLSPAILISLHERYGRELVEFLEAADPFVTARWSVSWAGDEESPMWFDVGRELTERWHHQQQIRDATGRPPLFDYLGPVLEIFVRGLPHAYRTVAADDGTKVVLRVISEGTGAWTLVREAAAWKLYTGEADDATTRVELRGDAAWRIFTKQKIDPAARIEGEARFAEPLLAMTAIVA